MSCGVLPPGLVRGYASLILRLVKAGEDVITEKYLIIETVT